MSDENENENENANQNAEAAESRAPDESTSPLPVLLILLAAPIAGIVMGNWITRGFCILLALFIIRGYRRGAARTVAALICLVAVPLLAIPLGRYTHGMFASMLGTSGITNRIISTTVCVIVLFVVFKIVIRFALGGAITFTGTRRLDKSLGGLLGMAQGGVIGLLLIWAILAVAPLAADSLAAETDPAGPAVENSQTSDDESSLRQRWSNRFTALGQIAEDSTVGRIARAISPVKDAGIIAMVRKAAIVLNDPAARERFLKHPAVAKLKDRPSVQAAIEKLKADPQMRGIMETGGGKVGKAGSLMNSAALQEVLDETDIVSELAPFRDGLREALDDAYTQIKPQK